MPHTNFTDDEKAKMDEYSAKIVQLKEKRRIQLEDIDNEIIAVQACLGAIHNKRSPLLRVPVELTCRIFTFAQQPRNKDKLEIEIVVSKVCHQWRSIALGLPKLWTTFYHEADGYAAVPLQRFVAYLERSAPLPLCIWFDFEADDNEPSNVELVEKAVEHAYRWQYFTMLSADELLLKLLYQLQETSAPMLECLTLLPAEQMHSNIDGDYPYGIISMFSSIFEQGAPKLTYLMLNGHSTMRTLPPLSHITILRIEKSCCDSMVVFEHRLFVQLLSLPSLNQLSLAGDLIEPFDLHRIIHMPNLKRFRVSQFDMIWDVLQCIRAPQLDTLIVHLSQFEPVLEEIGSAPPDQDYSFPALRKLYVVESEFPDPESYPDSDPITGTFIRLMKQATDVLILGPSPQTSLFQAIVDEGYAEVAWPQLKTLSCNIGEDNIDTYLTFARNRPRHSFGFRLSGALFRRWASNTPSKLNELKQSAVVVLEENPKWKLEEPFWPQNLDLGPDYDFGKGDEVCIRTYS